MSQHLLIAGILLMPMQVWSLFLMGSRFDLSPFVLLLLVAEFAIRQGVRLRSLIIFVSFVLVHVVLLVWLKVAPGYRVFSGVVWLGGLLFLLLEGSRLIYRQRLAFKAMLSMMTLSAVYILFQYFVLGYERPPAWFHEPSFAGLCLYASAAGVLMLLILVRRALAVQLFYVGLFVLLFTGAVLTLSMHIVTFIVTVTAILAFLWIPPLLRFRVGHLGFRTIVLIAVFGTALAYVTVQLLTMEHFEKRLEFANPTNFSLLSWLRGMDQMKGAVATSPIFGMGLGSTGYFPFPSRYSIILERMGKPILNLTDAYSLLFRLIIEIGLPLVLILIGYLVVRLRAFVAWVRSAPGIPVHERVAMVFNFVWGLAVIAGCFVKEPLYSQSFLYVATALVASVPLTASALAYRSAASAHARPGTTSTTLGAGEVSTPLQVPFERGIRIQ